MKKLLLVSLCFLLLVMTQVYAQNRTITGTVKAREDGLPLPGVTVRVKGTTTGALTNANGKYTISAPANVVLTFSSVGYLAADYPVPANGVLDVTMETSSHELNEVVINTAFGIAKAASTLGYDATSIGTKQLTQAGATNFTNGLTGKVAGLVVTTGDNGINPGTRFVLRGNRHILGNNFALVVLNGVPISPNDVNAINPDDIESVDILNGAAAAALYGSEGSNGAMVITTKKGSANGGANISYTNTYQLEKQSYQFPYQEQFGSYGGEAFSPFFDGNTNFIVAPVPYENQSYGPMFDGSTQMLGIAGAGGVTQNIPYAGATGKAYQNAIFQTGHAETNNLSYSSGDANSGFNLSVNRLDKTGVTPGDTYSRNVVRVGANHTYGIFKASFDVTYTNEKTSTGGLSVSTLLNTPSWVPLQNYQDVTQQFSDVSTFFNAYDSNPYYQAQKIRTNTRQDRFVGSFTGTLSPTKWFDFTYRLAGSFGIFQQQQITPEVDFNPIAQNDPNSNMNGLGKAAIVPGVVTNSQVFGDGSNSFNSVSGTGVGYTGSAGPQGFSRFTQDAIADFHNTFFNDFKTNLRVGSTIWQEYANMMYNYSPNLTLPGFYNINYITGVPTTDQETATIRQLAYFADLSVGYKDWATIEGTIRNEHDSRLSDANRSIWFPSVNASIVLTNAINSLKNNKIISYLKLRGSYAQVGDVNVGPYSYTANSYTVATNFPYGSLPGLSQSTSLGNATLKPELTKEFEGGIDYGLFDGRITGSITYYNDHTTNQTVKINTSASSGYQSTFINVGDLQNQGLEFKLDAQVLTKAKNKVGLDLAGNFAIQGSKVISILPNVNQVSVGTGSPGATEYAIVGSSYPSLYGNDIVRDPNGHPIVNATTGAVSPTTTPKYLGRITPKYILGLTQNLSYKFITLTITEEFRTGNVFLNTTEYSGVLAGTSKYSTTNGRSRFIFPNSVINTGTPSAPVYTPNTNVAVADGNLNFWDAGSFYNLASVYTENAAFWKIREADLVFDISQWAKKTKAIKRASIAFNGRNLFMWVPASNRTKTDPEFGSTGNATGIQSGNTAPTRIFGATLNVTF